MEEELFIDLGYNGYFENEINEIEDKIQKLKQTRFEAFLQIKNRILNNTEYSFWFLINNIEYIFYECVNDDNFNLVTEYNSFKKIKLNEQMDIKNLKKKSKEIMLLIDSNTYIEYAWGKERNDIFEIMEDIINFYKNNDKSLLKFEFLIRENCGSCKYNIICKMENCKKIKKENVEKYPINI